MRHEDKEMVPRVLVQAMFVLMIGSLSLVAYAQLADVPQSGVLVEAPIVQERVITLSGDRTGKYTVLDDVGTVIAASSDEKAGFLGVMGRVIERERELHGVALDTPISVVRRDNGHVGIIDPSTGMIVELIGYGVDNVAAFANLLN
jgi:putative photosynthetic complex assembly protein